MAQPIAIFFSPDGERAPGALRDWVDAQGAALVDVRTSDELMSIALRGRPRLVIFDARRGADTPLAACRRLKADSYTGIVPAITLTGADDAALIAAFEADSDEAIRSSVGDAELEQRLSMLLRRSDRDTSVHPSTRLRGTNDIEAEIGRRMAGSKSFAVCYADLDHFKEFNDRYSYYDGDRVIRILAKILHDVVKGLTGEEGFVGHIGGDDFIFIVPVDAIGEVCGEIVSIFDGIIPYQYSEQDRRAGYFFGKDRRGQLHRVPLMTVSIGVVTNERRHFTHASQVSELATEMKSYAKTLAGSVYSIDRRQDAGSTDAETQPAQSDTLGVAEGK